MTMTMGREKRLEAHQIPRPVTARRPRPLLPVPAYPRYHDSHLSTSNLHRQDSGMVAPTAFTGGGSEKEDSPGGQSLREGDTRRGPGQC